MKNHFFVFIEIISALIFWLCGGVGLFVGVALDGFWEDIGLSIFLTIMLVVLPTVLLIWGVGAFAARITVNEDGISKSFLCFKLKKYKWEDIDHIKYFGNSNYVKSVSFFKKRKEKSFLIRWIKYERIYFTCTQKKMAIVNHYAPEYIKEQLK